MKFESPYYFLLLIILGHLIFRKFIAYKSLSVNFSNSYSFEGLPRTWKVNFAQLPFILSFLAIISFITAMAQPKIREISMTPPKEGLAIELVMDTSSSMTMGIQYKGASESRMNVSKLIIKDFILGDEKGKVEGRTNDMIGLVTFARYADTRVPLTLAHNMLAFMIDEVDIESRMGEDGTAIGDAIALGAARLKTADENLDFKIKNKIMILLTDGANNCGNYMPVDISKVATEWKIKIYTILIGEDSKKVDATDAQGNAIKIEAGANANELTLQEVSANTGGKFYKATSGDSLAKIYKEIDALEKSTLKSVPKITWVEVFEYFVGLGFALMFLSVLLSSTSLRRIP